MRISKYGSNLRAASLSIKKKQRKRKCEAVTTQARVNLRSERFPMKEVQVTTKFVRSGLVSRALPASDEAG